MKSHLGLMLEQSWDLYMYPLMVLMMEIFRAYCFEVHWDIMMVNLICTDGKVLGSDEGVKLGYTDDEVIDTILGNTTSRWKS